mgnify:CR=1 FL=1
MNKIVTIVIVSIIALMAIIGVGMYFSYNNSEISLRNEAEAQRAKIEGVHDKMWKVIQQKAQVSSQYADKFDEIYTHIMSERYDSNDGSLMKWITEANPQFDSSLYKDLMSSIEILRTEFQKNQERMIDIIREHKNLCQTYPGKWFISNSSEIEYTVVSSTKSKVVMNTGLDDDVNVF